VQSDVEPKPAPTSKTEPKKLEPKPGGFFNRRRRTAAPSPSLPESKTPASESIAPEVTPEPENKPEPQLKTLPEEISPEVESTPLAEPPKEFKLQKRKAGGFFNRFRRSDAAPSPDLPPTLPEIVEPSASKVLPSEVAPQTETPEPDSVSPTSSLEVKPD
jgi:hypothetical protein